MPKIKSKISTFSAAPRDLEMLDVVARYHGMNKSATLVSLEEGPNARTIGVGVSPGDQYYAQPYAYVTPWPRFDGDKLPDPPPPGHWHTEGFFGAVLTGDDILAMADRGRGLLAFINAAFDLGRARLGA